MAGAAAASPAAGTSSQQRPPRRRRSSASSTSSAASSVASTLGPASSTASSPLLNSLSSTASGGFLQRRGSNSRRLHCGYGSSHSKPAQAARARGVAFASAILSALCAGSVTVFSLYGHIFQSRLRYTQYEVNGIAIASSLASYFPVPVLGYLCDRLGPAPLSLASSVLFGVGYAMAAVVFATVDTAVRKRGDGSAEVGGGMLAYVLMIVAFVCIGVGTASMYLSAVATCAKNFGKGKHRGLALAMPIAAFGLSGMWQSQFGSRILYERLPDGSHGDVDVVRFFIFLSCVLAVVGIVGFFFLRIVDEEELIEDAVEEMERSGLLDGSALFSPSMGGRLTGGSYGAIERSNPFDALHHPNTNGDANENTSLLDPEGGLVDQEEDEAKLKKAWVLDAETRRFLTDHTMWFFAAGFFLMVGPGEAFINNMGTVIQTLFPPSGRQDPSVSMGSPTTAATHVSIVGVMSTLARLATGTLTDLLAPSPHAQHIQLSASQILDDRSSSPRPWWRRKISISRVVFLIFFAILLSVGLAVQASGLAQNHGERFWIVSSLVGAGYGAVFSLTPIIITVIWGVENFATNWGIVATMPALGATMWGLIYSAVYQAGATASSGNHNHIPPHQGGNDGDESGGDLFCYGTQCYASTFWAMSVSVWAACGFVLFAWKGRNGWAQRGIVI